MGRQIGFEIARVGLVDWDASPWVVWVSILLLLLLGRLEGYMMVLGLGMVGSSLDVLGLGYMMDGRMVAAAILWMNTGCYAGHMVALMGLIQCHNSAVAGLYTID